MLESKRGAPGDRVLMHQFQAALQMLAPDCAEKHLCIFLPHRQRTDHQSVLGVLIQRLTAHGILRMAL